MESFSEVPTIPSSAMLVELKMSVWAGRKKDKNASTEVTDQNFAEAGTASVTKKLLGNSEELVAIQKFVANARNSHYDITLPWSDMGLRLLPTTQFFSYNEMITGLQEQFYTMVDGFVNGYSNEVASASARLGNLFSINDYPTPDTIRSKFNFRLSYIEVPSEGDFRIDVGEEQRAMLKDNYSQYYQKQFEGAMADLWKRLFTALSNMSEKLDGKDGDRSKCKVFRDSLVGNLLDVVTLLGTCNVTQDSQMEAMRMRLEDTFRFVTPEALREDMQLRHETKQAVDDALANLPTLDLF